MEIVGRLLQLNSGMTIPQIGFGTAASPQNIDQMNQAVATALKVGYRHFDTASIYGTEPALGEALSEAFQNGIAKREEVFVTSKLYAADHDDPVSALKISLNNLQVEYLDLYLIHWPINLRKGASHPSPKEDDFLPLDIESIWRGMEECVYLGLTKSIGVSNFSSKKIGDLLSYANIPPAVNQVEMHPLWQQKKLRDYCTKFNIHVSAYSPLGSFGTYYGSSAVMENSVLREIGEKHGKTVAQVTQPPCSSSSGDAIAREAQQKFIFISIKLSIGRDKVPTELYPTTCAFPKSEPMDESAIEGFSDPITLYYMIHYVCGCTRCKEYKKLIRGEYTNTLL